MSTKENNKVTNLGKGSSPPVYVSSARFVTSYKLRFAKANTSPTEAFTYCSLGGSSNNKMKMEFGNMRPSVQAEVKRFIGLCAAWPLSFIWYLVIFLSFFIPCEFTCPEIHCECLSLPSNIYCKRHKSVPEQHGLLILISFQEKL